MSLVPYKITALKRVDAGGTNIIPSASVTVTNSAGLSQLYTDDTGATPIANPFLCDANGEKLVWLNPGIHSFSVSGGQSWDENIPPSDALTPATGIKTIPTIANLTAQTGMADGQQFSVTGYNAGTNIGGGKFVWDASSVVAEDGGTVFESDAGGTGRFVRTLYSVITPEMFGCTSSSTAIEATRAINKCYVYASANKNVVVMYEQMAYPLDGNIDGTIDGATIVGQGRGGIQIKSNTKTLFTGQTFTMVESPYTAYSMVNFSGAEDFIVEGNATFIGDMQIHTGVTGEFGMGLYICNAHNGKISDLYVKDCWGDGCYVSDTDFTNLAAGIATASSNITISNCIFDQNRRQGLSGINGTHITFNDCQFINTGSVLSTAPSAGVDLETDASPFRNGMQHWTFNNCVMSDNVGPNTLVFPTLNNGYPGCYDIAFNNCRMLRTESQGSYWSDRAATYAQNITVNGGVIEGGVYGGNGTTFNGVVISRSMDDVSASLYAIELEASSYDVIFNDCTIKAIGDTTVNSKKLLFIPVGISDEEKSIFTGCTFIAEDVYGGAPNILLVTRSPCTFRGCEFLTEGTVPGSFYGFDTTSGNARLSPSYAMIYDCFIDSNWHSGTVLTGVANFKTIKSRSINAGTNAVPIAVGADVYEFLYPSGGSSTFSIPTDPYEKFITITQKNTSGGALGATTWTATAGGYKLAAWTNPASGFSRSITFRYDPTAGYWFEVSRTPADVPN